MKLGCAQTTPKYVEHCFSGVNMDSGESGSAPRNPWKGNMDMMEKLSQDMMGHGDYVAPEY